MDKKTKTKIRSGYYRRKRARAYKESAAINFLIGLMFILGGVFNTGTPSGTVFMFLIGSAMWWCACGDSKRIPKRKTSAFSEPFPTSTLVIIIIIIIIVLIFHKAKVEPYVEANKSKQSQQRRLT